MSDARREYRWRVIAQDLKIVEVTAKTRLQAVQEAGIAWGVPWTSIARTVTAENLGEVDSAEAKTAGEAKQKRGSGAETAKPRRRGGNAK